MHSYSASRSGFSLRPYEPGDIELTLQLRSGAQAAPYLPVVSSSRDEQLAWYKSYLSAPGDFHFAVEEPAVAEVRAVGVVGIQVRAGRAEFGRWALLPSSLAALPSVYLVSELVFGQFECESLHCHTAKSNESVVRLHESLGFARVGYGPPVSLASGETKTLHHRLGSADWRSVQSRLGAVVDRLGERIRI
jgi:RimJ/RimL family protein N-acetyltransferase